MKSRILSVGLHPPSRANGMNRAKKGVALVAAGVAVFSMGRMLSKHNAAFRQYYHRVEDWLKPRLERLSEELALSPEMATQISKEVQATVHTTLHLAEKARKAKPEKNDMLGIVLDGRLLKMKMKLHKILDIKEVAQADALHRFYEELREWIIPLGNHEHLNGSVKAEEQLVANA